MVLFNVAGIALLSGPLPNEFYQHLSMQEISYKTVMGKLEHMQRVCSLVRYGEAGCATTVFVQVPEMAPMKTKAQLQ